MAIYQTIILLSWVAFFLVWVVEALDIKRDVRGGYSRLWGQYSLLRIVAAVLIIYVIARAETGAHITRPLFFGDPLSANMNFFGWLGAFFTILGFGFAIWARFYLGRNWSPRPAIKEDHELVTTGPYAYVRHPIYSGMVLAGLGTAIAGSPLGLGILILGPVIFLARIPKEEKYMLELFPNEYPAYQARTKKLIPFIW